MTYPHQPGEEVDHLGRPSGSRLDREPEHGAGRQQEALPDERGDRPPLHLDEDDIRGALCVFCLLYSHQFNQLSKSSPP